MKKWIEKLRSKFRRWTLNLAVARCRSEGLSVRYGASVAKAQGLLDGVVEDLDSGYLIHTANKKSARRAGEWHSVTSRLQQAVATLDGGHYRG